ncbi:MAG: hypothetical protein AB7G48_13365 [Nitrospiraceae bacterium]
MVSQRLRDLRFQSVCWIVVLYFAGLSCSGLPPMAEQRRLIAAGGLPVHKVSRQAVLFEWGTPTYQSVQPTQFFVLSDGSWIPHFRVNVGESPSNWDLAMVAGDGIFLAYEEREMMLGFYQERLVYRESMGQDQIQAMGKLWQREALFKTRLESPTSVHPDTSGLPSGSLPSSQ